jgi:hypothetical protein
VCARALEKMIWAVGSKWFENHEVLGSVHLCLCAYVKIYVWCIELMKEYVCVCVCLCTLLQGLHVFTLV